MTYKQKQAIEVLNKLRYYLKVEVFTEDDYWLLLDFVVGTQEPSITISKYWDDESKSIKDYPIPITVLYGCGIPDSMTTYTSTKNDNANKIE